MADVQACEYEEIGGDWKVVSDEGRRVSEWMSKLGLMGDDDAAPEQLERLAFMMDWGPIMELPVRNHRGQIRPAIDEQGQLDWGAFGTVDFERLRGPFDVAGYKADKLQDELRHNVLMLQTVAERVPVEAQIRILEQGRTGVLDLDEVEDADEWLFARRYLRIKRLRNEIRELRKQSWQRRWSQ
jgi:hypothetical protein